MTVPPHLVPREAITPHIDKLRAAGMSYILIARRGRLAHSTVRELHRGIRTACSRDNARRILSVRPGQFDNISQQPAIGTARRMQAMYALGHHRETIRAATGDLLSLTAISSIANGIWQTVDGSTARAVRLAYKRLAGRRGTCGKAAARARREGWALPAAWDDDRIDDPTAIPDWTGHCGTNRGWWMHRLNKIPVCGACEHVHGQWLAERTHLTHDQRWAEMGRERAAASSRGADLAADGRELLAQGYTTAQAARRLGVTRPHLETELRRHPDATNWETAA